MSSHSRFSSLVGEICQLKSLRPTNPAAHYPNIPALLMPMLSDFAHSKDRLVNAQADLPFPASPDDVLSLSLDSVCVNSFDRVCVQKLDLGHNTFGQDFSYSKG